MSRRLEFRRFGTSKQNGSWTPSLSSSLTVPGSSLADLMMQVRVKQALEPSSQASLPSEIIDILKLPARNDRNLMKARASLYCRAMWGWQTCSTLGFHTGLGAGFWPGVGGLFNCTKLVFACACCGNGLSSWVTKHEYACVQ